MDVGNQKNKAKEPYTDRQIVRDKGKRHEKEQSINRY